MYGVPSPDAVVEDLHDVRAAELRGRLRLALEARVRLGQVARCSPSMNFTAHGMSSPRCVACQTEPMPPRRACGFSRKRSATTTFSAAASACASPDKHAEAASLASESATPRTRSIATDRLSLAYTAHTARVQRRTTSCGQAHGSAMSWRDGSAPRPLAAPPVQLQPDHAATAERPRPPGPAQGETNVDVEERQKTAVPQALQGHLPQRRLHDDGVRRRGAHAVLPQDARPRRRTSC